MIETNRWMNLLVGWLVNFTHQDKTGMAFAAWDFYRGYIDCQDT